MPDPVGKENIILGALLAGLNGGLIYNTWPDMNGYFLPNDTVLNDYFELTLLNNPSVIQLFHRITAYILFFLDASRTFNVP